jgi:hypothetical protein
MQKARWARPLYTYPTVALIVLAAAVLLWIYKWVSFREGVLNEQAFQTLAVLSDQLTIRLASIAEVSLSALNENPPDPAMYTKILAPDLEHDPECIKSERWPTFEVISFQGSYFFRVGAAKEKKTTCLRASVDRTLTPFVASARDVFFDEIILAEGSGRVVFQTKGSEIRRSVFGSLDWSHPWPV